MADWTTRAALVNPNRRKLLTALCSSTVAGASGLGHVIAQAATTTSLQCSGAYSDSLFHTQNLKQFAQQVGTLSQGAVQIDVVSNSKLMPMKEVMPALSKGDLAMGEIFMSNFSQQYPLFAIDSLPFIVRNSDDAKRLWNATRPPIEALLKKQGIRLLYAAPWPGQGLFAHNPINRLADLKGLKFRVNNEATVFISDMSGASSVDIAANNLLKAIQNGQVDVMVTSSTTGVDSQAWNAMGTFMDVHAWIPKNLILFSEQHWAKLPEPTKKAIETSAKQAEERGWQLAKDADDAAQKVLAGHGVKILPPSYELRRELNSVGEKFARGWAKNAGVDSSSALIGYYFAKGENQ